MTSKIKRVVLMANNPDAVGGITTFVNTIAPGFRDAGYEVELVTVEHMHSGGEYLLDASFKHRIGTANSMPEKRQFVRIRDYINPVIYRNRRVYHKLQKQACENLAKMYKEWGRDTVVIITQMYGAEHLIQGGIDLTSGDGPYVVGMFHASYEQSLEASNLKRLKACFKDVDKLMCLTEYDAKLFRDAGFTNMGFVHNPVAIMAKQGINQDKEKLVVSIGRYHHHKSLNYMLDAWGELSGEYSDWRLELYGGGEEQAKLQKQIDRLGIASNAVLMGKTNDVPGVLAKASINAMSSQQEGLPIAIVEAARFDVPTVSFDCAPGIRELIDDGKTGIVVPRNNSHLLAEALKSLMEDDKKRVNMGSEARTESMKYKTTSIVQKWQELFDELVV